MFNQHLDNKFMNDFWQPWITLFCSNFYSHKCASIIQEQLSGIHFLHLSHTLTVFVRKSLLHFILSAFTNFFLVLVSLIHKFSTLQVTESWVGPGNKTMSLLYPSSLQWMYRVMLKTSKLLMQHSYLKNKNVFLLRHTRRVLEFNKTWHNG